MDDTEYLFANGTRTSHLALIDSAKRDVSHYPTASQFDVVFDNPYLFVYGVDLLGVTVPRTEYIVSSSRNTLVFSYGVPGEGSIITVRVPEGNYDESTFPAALNSALASAPSGQGSVVSAAGATSPVSVANRLVFTCQETFTLYLTLSSLRVVTGFGNPVDPKYPGYSAPGWKPGGPDTICSVPSSGTTSTSYAYTPAGPSAGTVTGADVSQTFQAAQSGLITQALFNVSSQGPAKTTLGWAVQTTTGVMITSGTVEPSGQGSVGVINSAAGLLVKGRSYQLALSSPAGAFQAGAVQSGGAGTLTVDDDVVADTALSADVVVQSASTSVSAPGLVDLTGERYIVLRCLEIEAAINGSRAFENYNAGVGIIQLQTYGYTNQSFDYSAYPPREFQPIARLNRLSLSFQKPDGGLYDFKGLDVQLLMLIRYVQPGIARPKHDLAPHYTSDLILSQSRQLQEEVACDPRYSWHPTFRGTT